MIEDANELSGPGLVSWLVANTEDLVGVAEALERRASELEPAIPKESVIRLCNTVRQSALETTVALLGLLADDTSEHEDSMNRAGDVT